MRPLPLAEPSRLFLLGTPAWRGPGRVLTAPVPGLGHDSALLQTRQLQSELEALQGLRAEEAEATATGEDLLRLTGQERPLVLSASKPHVSPA